MVEAQAWRYPVFVRPDVLTDGSFCYVAEHPDLPGCVAYGRTISEAKEALEQARAAYIQQLLAEGGSIPTPSRAGAHAIEWEAASPPSSQPSPVWTADPADWLRSDHLTVSG